MLKQNRYKHFHFTKLAIANSFINSLIPLEPIRLIEYILYYKCALIFIQLQNNFINRGHIHPRPNR